MKRRTMLAVVLAVVLVLLLAGTAIAFTLTVSLHGVIYPGTFIYGNCKVTSVEYQVEHRLGGLHLFSTNVGSVQAADTASGGCDAIRTLLGLPPGSPLVASFAAIDIFNPLGPLKDKYVIKSYGLAGIVDPQNPLLPPKQLGANAWRVSTNPVTLCGYAYFYGGNYSGSDQQQLVIPFRATISGNDHIIQQGSCLSGMPSP
jgi:hypothetical protein